ncbi:hypothetical protein P245_05415 [Comamonas thiooxydans]|uniref:Uncharacterized protein n=1 Tax=Comamonas thiooxydans TaxID=363952 RepID=A0A0E3BJ22_9BURK|nr:hypothetical protein P245_05415 [Comamonas thiooxydans]
MMISSAMLWENFLKEFRQFIHMPIMTGFLNMLTFVCVMRVQNHFAH